MSRKFKKQEKLKSRKMIGSLFKEGLSAKAFPVLAVYRPLEQGSLSMAGFSVSARKFKRAVDRNKLKRRMREAYRLNKPLIEREGYAVMFIYIGTEIMTFSEIERGVIKVLEKIKADKEA